MSEKDRGRSGGDRPTPKAKNDKTNHTPIRAQLKAMLIAIAAYDVGIIALLALIVWGVLR